MKRILKGFATLALAFGLLPAFNIAIQAPYAHAANSVSLPALLGRGLAHPHLPGSQPSDTNVLVDSDIELMVSTAATQNVAAEGWLHLAKKGAGYAGTFIDNLAGGKSFPASGTNVSTSSDDGIYTINTGNGKFTIVISRGSVTGTAPTKYGSKLDLALGWFAHQHITEPSLTADIGLRTWGSFLPSISGTLTLVIDINGYIVPFNKKINSNSGLTYKTGTKSRFAPITGPGFYTDLNHNSRGGLTMTIKIDQTVISIPYAAEDDTGGTPSLFGLAYGHRGKIHPNSRFRSWLIDHDIC